MREVIRRAAPGGHRGLWLSLVERLVRDEEAVGSNPTSPMAHFLNETVCHSTEAVLALRLTPTAR
jgi:hypothetical protein